MALLESLADELDGAVALVSGRSIATLDRLFAPFASAAVGLHGLEIRLGPGSRVSYAPPQPVPSELDSAVQALVRECPGCFIEDKTAALAVHHRLAAPAMQALRRKLLAVCRQVAPGWTVLRGRKVLEIKPDSTTKAHGCHELMRVSPFAGTLPVAFGDDVTDLDLFEAVKQYGGLTVAVGRRIAAAGDLQVPGPQSSVALLNRLRQILGDGHAARAVFEKLQVATQV